MSPHTHTSYMSTGNFSLHLTEYAGSLDVSEGELVKTEQSRLNSLITALAMATSTSKPATASTSADASADSSDEGNDATEKSSKDSEENR